MLGLWNIYPATPGHAMVVPRRHVENWFEATREEQIEMALTLEIARQVIEQRHSPAGFNIGINLGDAGGQTVPHLHMHLVPRYAPGEISAGSDVSYFARSPILKRLRREPLLTVLEDLLKQAYFVDAAWGQLDPGCSAALAGLLQGVVARGGTVRLLLSAPWIAPAGVQVRLSGELGASLWRVSDLERQETAFFGPADLQEGAWMFQLHPLEDRDGQRDVRKVFEELWAKAVSAV